MSCENGPMPENSAPTPSPVGVAVSVQPGPDGTPWVALHLSAGTSTYVVCVNPDGADMLAEQLPGGLRDAARKARKDGSPLQVASADTLRSLKK